MGKTLAGMFTAVLTTLAGKIIMALGISAISYTGLNLLQTQMINALTGQLSAAPLSAVQIMYIGGLGVALNWILGAVAFFVSFNSVAKLGSIFRQK